MAELNSNITIKQDLRLCKVHGQLAYFHTWEQWYDVIGESALRGGHPSGQIGQVYGIVEFQDGVRRVDPVKIEFCDEENSLLSAMNEREMEL